MCDWQVNVLNWFASASLIFTGIIGIVGLCWILAYLICETIDIWVRTLKLKDSFFDFVFWKAKQDREESKR